MHCGYGRIGDMNDNLGEVEKNKSLRSSKEGNNRLLVTVVCVLFCIIFVLAVAIVIAMINKNDGSTSRVSRTIEECDTTRDDYDFALCAGGIERKAIEIYEAEGEDASLAFYEERINDSMTGEWRVLTERLVYYRANMLKKYEKCDEAIQSMKVFPTQSFSGRDKVFLYSDAKELSKECEKQDDIDYFSAKIEEIYNTEEVHGFAF